MGHVKVPIRGRLNLDNEMRIKFNIESRIICFVPLFLRLFCRNDLLSFTVLFVEISFCLSGRENLHALFLPAT